MSPSLCLLLDRIVSLDAQLDHIESQLADVDNDEARRIDLESRHWKASGRLSTFMKMWSEETGSKGTEPSAAIGIEKWKL